MKQAIESLVVLVLVVIIGGALVAPSFLDQRQSKVAANPDFVTSRSSPEIYELDRQIVESLGRYQVCLDPGSASSSLENSEFHGTSRADSLQTYSMKFMLTSPYESLDSLGECDSELVDWTVELELIRCFPDKPISGGQMRIHRGDESWELEFYQLGSRGIVYSDTLPNGHISELGKAIDHETISSELTDVLDAFYSASKDNLESEKEILAKTFVRLLIGLLSTEPHLQSQS